MTANGTEPMVEQGEFLKKLTAAERFALDSLAKQQVQLNQQMEIVQQAINNVIADMGLDPAGDYAIQEGSGEEGDYGSIHAKNITALTGG